MILCKKTRGYPMEQSRQYQEMLNVAKKKLEERLPEEIAEKGNLNYNAYNKIFEFETFGKKVYVSYPNFEISPSLGMWHCLTILQYMDEADGYPLSGKWIGLSDFKDGGLVRGSSFDGENEQIIRRKIGKLDEATIMKAAETLGGKKISDKADLSILFRFMPNFPVKLNLWFEDEEFPASGKVLCDQSAEHYLKIEAAGTVGGLLLQKLEEAYDNILENIYVMGNKENYDWLMESKAQLEKCQTKISNN
jgi:hypothetical protein